MCENVTLHGKINFADLSKLRILSWRDFLGISRWAQWCNYKDLYADRKQKQRDKGKKIWGCYPVGFEGKIRDYQPKGVGDFLEAGKDKKTWSPGAFRRNTDLWVHFRALISRIIINVCCLNLLSSKFAIICYSSNRNLIRKLHAKFEN